MASTDPLTLCLPYEAGEDLSSSQYKFVRFDANGRVVECDGADDIPLGVLQNDPDAVGKAATVCVIGRTKVQADADHSAVAYGTAIGTSADGQADVKVRGTDLAEFIAGYLDAGTRGASAGALERAVINCINSPTAAAVA